MLNQVLWILDNEMDDRQFERLCTDLLYRIGYTDILPLGGAHDRGRDAELPLTQDSDRTSRPVFFQYSLNKNWRAKLLSELKKVQANRHTITTFVFVTSQKVTGATRDNLAQMVQETYGWQLQIYDREWLRLQLEEAHPDLAVKYLGVSVDFNTRQVQKERKPEVPRDEMDKRAWQLYDAGDYEAAIVELRKWLRQHKDDIKAWLALSWAQYCLYRYQDALVSINRALALDKENIQSLSMKASILTEEGIRQGLKANLILAKDIFRNIASKSNDWDDHYNYANTLSALGEYEEARQEYLAAINLDAGQPQVWKNLGTVYYHLHDHEAEINCYDKALELNKQHPEALASKGLTLLVVFRNAKEGVTLLERAKAVDEDIAVRWPDIWYWLGEGYRRLGELTRALEYINTGLDNAPHHAGLLQLKASILSKLWRKDSQFIDKAISFFQFYTEVAKDKYTGIAELARLYEATAKEEAGWSLLEKYIGLDITEAHTYLKSLGYGLDKCITSLKYLRIYEEYRYFRPIRYYKDLFTTETEEVMPISEFWHVLFAVSAIPFGLCYDVIFNVPQNERHAGVIKSSLMILRDSFETLLPRLSVKFVDAIRSDNIDNMAARLSAVIAGMADLGLRELSGQMGFIGGRLLISQDVTTNAVLGEELGKWQAGIASNTLIAINEKLQMFPG